MALRFPRPFGRANRATSSKPARFIRHWRRFADFPSRGRPQGSPLRRGYKRRGEVRNPPVTASPCQPPLGKGAKGTGDADCHTSDIGHWFAMTGGFTRGAVQAGKFAFYFSRKNKHRPDCCQGRCFAPWYHLASPPAHAKTASRSAATLLRCHGRPRSSLKPPRDPRPDGSGAMFPPPFRARFHLPGLSLAA